MTTDKVAQFVGKPAETPSYEAAHVSAANGKSTELSRNCSKGLAEYEFLIRSAEFDEKDDIDWLAQSTGLPPALQLPRDYMRPAVRSTKCDRAWITLDAELCLSLRRLGAARGSSAFTAYLAVFTLLMHRLSGQEDIVVGVPLESCSPGRKTALDLVANAANLRPIRGRAECNSPFVEYLDMTRRLVTAAGDDQEYFFGHAADPLSALPNSASSPFFSVLFNYEGGEIWRNTGRQDIQSANTESAWRAAVPATVSELFFNLAEIPGGGLEVRCDYCSDFFRQETIQRWLGHFRTLLRSIVANPEGRIWELPLLTESERDRLIVEWNQTDTEFPSNASIAELFESHAAEAPEAIAVEHREVRWTYSELNSQANRLAHRLREAGAGPEALIGICLERSPELIAGMLGILKAGCAYVPIDPECPTERCARILADVSLVVTSPKFANKFVRSTAQLVYSDGSSVPEANIGNPEHLSHGGSLAYVIYTSGSSGQPKGVAVPHRGVVRLLRNTNFITFHPSDAVAQIMNPCFDASVQEVWGPLLNGARLVIFDKDIVLSPPKLVHELRRCGITILFTPTALFNSIVREVPAAFANLKYVVFGGEPADLRSVSTILSEGAPKQLINAYGPTEATVAATCWKIRTLPASKDSVPIGKPISNTTVYVLDRLKNPVPIGVAGEIYIGGPGVARGYVNANELTGERFIADPFSARPDARLYRTGDLARWLPDGSLEFIDRADRQVKIRGVRIEPGELETVLNQHPAVQAAAVEVREDNCNGKVLIAYVAGDGSQLSQSGIRDFLKTCLPQQMIPSGIVILEELPLNANGKIDRTALPWPIKIESEQTGVAPRDPLEQQLVAIWREMLGVQALGVTDDFFAIGGHSLMAVRLLLEIERVVGKNLPATTLFEAPTIEKLAAALRKTDPETDPEVMECAGKGECIRLSNIPAPVPVDAERPRIASYAQQRLWFIDQIGPDTFDYNLPLAFRIRGELNLPALERSLSALVRRHDVLRATFRPVDGELMQFVAPAQDVRLPISKLLELEPTERALREREILEAIAWTPFDLARGPLMRTRLLRTDVNEHVLVVNLHHIIYDNWSDRILLEELITGYRAFVEGREPELADLPIQYADYAQWQRASLQQKRFAEQLEYWRRQLADLPVLQLPVGHRHPRTRTASGASVPLDLPPQLTNSLKTLGKSESATLFMTMLAAFNLLLVRYTGEDDIVIGSPIADRGRAELANVIGLFLNTLVLRTKLDGNPTFREVLRRVRATALEAYRNHDLPFDAVVQMLAPKRDPNQNPLFQVAFVLVDQPPETYTMGNLRLDRIAIEDRTAKFDLTVMLFEGLDGLRGYFNYNADLFEAETVRRMAGHFRLLLEGIAAAPETRISEFAMLSTDERDQLIVAWNRTETEYPRDASINELLEHQAEQTPDSIAVEDDATRWTYRELNERANQLAYALRGAGAKLGTLIGICIERSAEMIAGILAILKAGAAYVPIDPAYPATRRTIMFEGVSLLLTAKKLASELIDCAVPVVCVDDASISSASRANLPRLANGASLAYVIYTSGSSGIPKGVAIQHRAVSRLVLNTNYIALGPSEVVAQNSNACFDAATFEIWGALLNGARLVIINRNLTLSPSSFADEIERRAITTIWLTTSLFNLMAQHLPNGFANLHNVLFGGEAADPQSVAKILRHGAPRRLLNCYGPTETTTFAACHEVRHVPENALTIPIGRPISNTTIYLLDNYRNPVPIGVAGEIYIGGPGVARDYFGAPEVTAERFIADPFCTDPDARLYKTGDLARWCSDGTIDFLGRIDQQVKIRGFRIEPGEIEAALKQHPAVREAVALLREQSGKEKRLIAYVSGESALLRESDLREFLRSSLPDYMLPSTIVALEQLPLNANGKVDRHALPESVSFLSEEVSLPPRNSLETQLVAIWEKVLGVQPIGVNDDFFDLGGDSLLAVRIFLEIEKRLGKSLPLSALFEKPTIERLAAKMHEEMSDKGWAPLVAIQLLGSRPPFFAIHSRDGNVLYYRKLSQCLGKSQPFYALQSQGLDGKPVVRKSVEAIADYYLQEIRKVRPHGPYLLGGYCFGGVVAYEMAQQLRAAGEKVPLLVLFDSFNPAKLPRLRSLKERIRGRVSYPVSLTPERILAFLARHARGSIGALVLHGYERFQRALLMRSARSGQNTSPELLSLRVRMVHERAFFVYRPLPYRGKVTLFRACDQPPEYQIDEDLGWSRIVQGGIEIHPVAGAHESIFSDANVAIVAEKLQGCIRAASLGDANLT